MLRSKHNLKSYLTLTATHHQRIDRQLELLKKRTEVLQELLGIAIREIQEAAKDLANEPQPPNDTERKPPWPSHPSAVNPSKP